ncbi:vitamin K epoxide reductase family protein [Adhaeretor mobilis]|uniref:Vitamin K epoxide reductase family protein n=1 Tax=Adhaeretor mobilis TaxID=1930276 RepID=A0A517MYF2_9BACT|nr:vitamin K epoxide reductase family protein [Adhaeretor mobilis]QDS99847.1 Vitamin K epoxide reductase family protein [Adhaeretor mobilis]
MSTRSKILATLISLLSLAAAGVAGYLTWATFNSTDVAGCTGEVGFDCDTVLSSQWSKWLGLPVSLFGLVVYLGIAAICWLAARRQPSWAPTVLLALGLLAAGAGLWFVGLQIVMVKSFCSYCLTVHSCGIVIGVLSLLLAIGTQEEREFALWNTSQEFDDFDEDSSSVVKLLVKSSVMASLGLAVLMGGQVFFASPTMRFETDVEFATLEEVTEHGDTEREYPNKNVEDVADTEASNPSVNPGAGTESKSPAGGAPTGATQAEDVEPDAPAVVVSDDPPGDEAILSPAEGENSTALPAATERMMSFKGLRELLDVRDMPIMGDPEAKYVVVEMLDYTCKHCRHLHALVHASQERYGKDLAYVIYHTPLSKKCNRYSKKSTVTTANSCEYAYLAIGVWKLAPEKFSEFHEWLMKGDKPPSIRDARRKALALAGNDLLNSDELRQDIKRRFAIQCGGLAALQTGLPVVILEQGLVKGVPTTESEWFEFLEANLGVKAKDR